MFEHFIVMASSYVYGKRIAFQSVYQGGIDYNGLKGIIETLQSIGDGKESFSTHYVCTDAESWESVVSYDAFFEDAYVVESLEEFIYMLRKDLKLSGLDVARYILSKHRCTHLELEKLTYLCFADYLCKYGKRLYDDTIYAYTYGPVVESVYGKYTRQKGQLSVNVDEFILKSRILVLPDGMEKLQSIDETVDKYSKCTASELICITHSENSPWKMKDATKPYQIIDDQVIEEHHIFEEQYFEKRYGTS